MGTLEPLLLCHPKAIEQSGLAIEIGFKIEILSLFR